jgi:MFS family permease
VAETIEQPTPSCDADVVAAPLRRNRDFQILWSGRALSELGSDITELAYPLLMLAITGSAGYAGMLGSAQLLTVALLILPAGMLADHANRRTVMIGCDLARVALLGGLAVAIYLDVVTIPWIITTAIASSAFGALFGPCSAGAVKQVVPVSQLAAAQAQNEARGSAVVLVAPPLGGWLFSLGRFVPFAADALSYLLGAIALLFIGKPLQRKRSSDNGLRWRGAFDGLKFIFAIPYLRMILVFAMVANMMLAGFGLALIATLKERGAADTTVGVMFSAMGVLGLLGALLTPWILRKMSAPVLFTASGFAAAVIVAALAAAPGVILPVGLAALLLFSVTPLNALFGTYLMSAAPDHLQGRVSAAIVFLSQGLKPVGPIVVGTLFDAGGAGLAFSLMAAMLTAAALLLLHPAVRHMPTVAAATRE